MEHKDMKGFTKHDYHITNSLRELCDYTVAHKDIDLRVRVLLYSVLGAIRGGDESLHICSEYMVEASKKILETNDCDEGSN